MDSAAELLEKGPTFEASRQAILAHLKEKGWSLSGTGRDGRPLKVQHATSPDGQVRLWFKAQAVYYTFGNQHSFGSARSVHSDIRTMTPEAFVADAMSFAKRESVDTGLADALAPLIEGSVRSPDEMQEQLVAVASELAKIGSRLDQIQGMLLDAARQASRFLPNNSVPMKGKRMSITPGSFVSTLHTEAAQVEEASKAIERVPSILSGIASALDDPAIRVRDIDTIRDSFL